MLATLWWMWKVWRAGLVAFRGEWRALSSAVGVVAAVLGRLLSAWLIAVLSYGSRNRLQAHQNVKPDWASGAGWRWV